MEQTLPMKNLTSTEKRYPDKPTSEEMEKVEARHCNSGQCPIGTQADRRRRDGAPQWVCKRAPICDV